MAGVSFSMVRPQRLVEDDNENLVEDNASNLVQRLKQQQMATDTKVSRVLDRLERPTLKCTLQITFLILLTIAVIIIAAKLWSLPSSGDQDSSLAIHQKILEALTKRDYKTPEAACPSKLFTYVGPTGRWDSCYYVHYPGLRNGPGDDPGDNVLMTMEQGRELCAKLGAHLLAIETKLEAKYIEHLSLQERSWLAASNADNGVDWLWMGLGDGGQDLAVNFSFWAIDEPKKQDGYHCAYVNDRSHWRASKCDEKRLTICETPAKAKEGDGKFLPRLIHEKTPERFCPDNSTACYLFVHTRLRWKRASDYCVEHGGYLARPDSLGENTKLKEWIYAHSADQTARNSHKASWLGASGKRLEMKWTSNAKLLSESFQDWRSDAVSTDEELCLAFNITSRMNPHDWSAASCYRWLNFICEIPTEDEVEETVEKSVISDPLTFSIEDDRANCAFESNGADYRGTETVSSTGGLCLPWRHFHSHHLVVDTMLNSNLEKNYCRNPNNESSPWCFVGSKQHPRWEYCDIPVCKVEDFTDANHLCGAGRPKYGLASTCDGASSRPCCSAAGFCGSDVSNCQCFGCKDYRTPEPVHPLLGPSYIIGPKGNYYAYKYQHKNWEDARKVCKKDGGDLAGEAIFLAEDPMEMLAKMMQAFVKIQNHPYFSVGAEIWMGLSTSQFNNESQDSPWSWVSGKSLEMDSLKLGSTKISSRDIELSPNATTYPSGDYYCAQLLVSRRISSRSPVAKYHCRFRRIKEVPCSYTHGTHNLAFICEVSVNDTETEPKVTPPPPPPTTVSSINSSYTLHFIQSQRSHEAAEKFCAENFSGGKLVALDSAKKRARTGELAVEVARATSGQGAPSGPTTVGVAPLTYWWVGAGSILTSALTLQRGNNVSSGNVFIGGQPVCDDSWDHTDARVVCRQLGYHNGTATFNSHFGTVPSNFAMDQVECLGHEEHLKLCPHSKIHDCGTSEGAGVNCYGKLTSEELAQRRERKVCQRATYTDDNMSRYNPPWSRMIQVNCKFSHWFICESDVERTITHYTLVNGTKVDAS